MVRVELQPNHVWAWQLRHVGYVYARLRQLDVNRLAVTQTNTHLCEQIEACNAAEIYSH